MMDFLKSYPFLTVEDYYWNYSHIMIQLMLKDATKVFYLSEKQAEEYKNWKLKQTATKSDNLDDVASAMGLPKKKKLKK